MKIRVNFKESSQTFRVTAEDLGVVINKGGTDGAVFYPIVSEDGIISWTNNAALPNPDPVNIKGPPGIDGISPVVDVEAIPEGHRITITDKNGPQIFDILNGIANNDAIADIVASKTYSKQEVDDKLKTKADAKTLTSLVNYIGIIPDSANDKTLIDYLNQRIDEVESTATVATENKLGGVKSAVDEVIVTDTGTVTVSKPNAVYVNATGEMSIKKLTTDILSNGEKELILKGGSAKASFN